VTELPEVMRCVLLRMSEVLDGGICLLEVSEALQVPEVMRCVQVLCMLCGFRNVHCGSFLVKASKGESTVRLQGRKILNTEA